MNAFLLVLATAAAATSQATPDPRFDLICTGTKTALANQANITPWEARFRIDLERKIWCGADCAQVFEISEVSDLIIDLGNMKISRITGDVKSFGPPASVAGHCQEEQFSKIPEKQF